MDFVRRAASYLAIAGLTLTAGCGGTARSKASGGKVIVVRIEGDTQACAADATCVRREQAQFAAEERRAVAQVRRALPRPCKSSQVLLVEVPLVQSTVVFQVGHPRAHGGCISRVEAREWEASRTRRRARN